MCRSLRSSAGYAKAGVYRLSGCPTGLLAVRSSQANSDTGAG